MNKKIIALAVAMLPAAAMADVTIYGEAGAAFVNSQQKSIYNEKTDKIEHNSSVNKVENFNSKIGFKGSEDLGNGLKAIWQVEQAIDLDGDTASTWATRDSFVGLSGDFGTVQLGRLSNFQNIYSNVDPWKYAAGSSYNGLAFVSNLDKDGKAVYGGIAATQDRLNNSIAYTTPEWNGFLARAMYSAAGEERTAQGQAESVWELGLRYAAAGFYGQYSYTQGKNADVLGGADADYKNKMHYLEGGYDANNLLVALTYLQTKSDGINDVVESGKQKQVGLNVAYTIGQFVPHFQYAHGWKFKEDGKDLEGSDYDQYVLGVNYNLSKRTMAHLSAGWVKSGDNAAGERLLDARSYAAGLTHLF